MKIVWRVAVLILIFVPVLMVMTNLTALAYNPPPSASRWASLSLSRFGWT